MDLSKFTAAKPTKKVHIQDFLEIWGNFYEKYEDSMVFSEKKEVQQINIVPISNFPQQKIEEKKSFKKIKRSKTIDVGAFLNSLAREYEFNIGEINRPSSYENKVKNTPYYEGSLRGENSMDFSTIETTITPLRDLRIEDQSVFSPYSMFKESPKPPVKDDFKAKSRKIEELKNTLKRSDNTTNNKETRKYSMKKGAKKQTKSSRILNFD